MNFFECKLNVMAGQYRAAMIDKRHEFVSASINTVQLHRLHQGKHQLVSFLYDGNPVLLCHHVELAIERMRRQEASFVHGLT